MHIYLSLYMYHVYVYAGICEAAYVYAVTYIFSTHMFLFILFHLIS